MRLGKLRYFGTGLAILLGGYFFFFFGKPTCRLSRINDFTIATVAYGCFAEFIPQSGIVELDSITGFHNVKVIIDQLYLPRISTGLRATSYINSKNYELTITNVYPTVTEGRFNIDMNFCDEIPSDASDGKSLRLRIELNEPSDEILLPVGSFYFDTQGLWIYVVKNGNLAVRRTIRLGRKMGSEYFEVLEGLKPGEDVITSSYEKFPNVDSLDVSELKMLHQI
jgi:hypothetical protein